MSKRKLGLIITTILTILFLVGNFYFTFHNQQFKYLFYVSYFLLMTINFYISSTKIYEKVLYIVMICVSCYFFLGPVLLIQTEKVEWNPKSIRQDQYEFTVSLYRVFDYPISIDKKSIYNSEYNISIKKNKMKLHVKQLSVEGYHRSYIWLMYKVYKIPLGTYLNTH